MVKPTRVNYYVVVAGGLFFLAIGLYRLYEGIAPPSYYDSADVTRALVVGTLQLGFALVWLYFAYRSGGHVTISGGQLSQED